MENEIWQKIISYWRKIFAREAIKALSSAEYAATTRAKRKGTKKGKQFVKQPKGIAKKTAKYRRYS